jgi:hypothetical protein
MSRYTEVDLSRVQTTAVRRRKSLVDQGSLYRPAGRLGSFDAFFDSMPDVLGARDLRAVIAATLASRRKSRPVIALAGAHVLKTGMGPGLIAMIEAGVLTGIGTNGAGAVHDIELALWGRTSEDVGAELHAGRFGMARETAEFLNDATREAARRGEGLGEALGRILLKVRKDAHKRSVIAAAYRKGIPATVHVAIGTDINHQHPSFDGAATGDASARDFRILAASLLAIRGGTVLVFGSAVILPEVFLKAYSVACNLGAKSNGMTTAVFDFVRHYRPMENVVRRPTSGVGKGYYLVGQHEILLPLFFHACLAGSHKLLKQRKLAPDNS